MLREAVISENSDLGMTDKFLTAVSSRIASSELEILGRFGGEGCVVSL